MEVETQKTRITNEFNRGKLSEGRNFGVGFSILEKKLNNRYKALTAFTACKDYLNDFMYVEGTGKALDTIYGFKHEYTGILKDKDHFYLGLTAVHYNHAGKYEKFDEINKLFKENAENLVKLLNKIEEAFGENEKSKIQNYLEDTLIIKVPIFWSKFSFLFSLYGLLVRVFINITEEELKKDIKDIIKDKNAPLIVADNMLFQPLKKLFADLDKDLLLDYKYPEPAFPSQIHNFGICSRLQQIPKYK